jgi:hypothetical protein
MFGDRSTNVIRREIVRSRFARSPQFASAAPMTVGLNLLESCEGCDYENVAGGIPDPDFCRAQIVEFKSCFDKQLSIGTSTPSTA